MWFADKNIKQTKHIEQVQTQHPFFVVVDFEYSDDGGSFQIPTLFE